MLFSDHMVTTEREDGLVHFRVRSLDAGNPKDISFPEPTYSVGPGAELPVRHDASSGSPIPR